MHTCRASSRSRSLGKSSPYAWCSRSHQPAPSPQNARPPLSTSRVAAALAMMPGARKVTGETRVPSRSRVSSPASRPRVTHGSGIGSQARSTWGIWIRWSIRASPANPYASAARARSTSQAVGSSSGHGNRDTCSITSGPLDLRPEPVGCALSLSKGRGRCLRWALRRAQGALVARLDHDQVPALLLDLGDQPADAPELLGDHRRRHRPVAVPVAPPAQRRRGVEHHQHGRQPGGPGHPQVVPAAVRVQPEGVDHRGQAAAGAGGDDLVEQVEGLGGRVQVGGSAAHHRPQRVRGDDLGGPEAVGRPGGLARSGRAGQHDHGGSGSRGVVIWARSRVSLRAPRGCKGVAPLRLS